MEPVSQPITLATDYALGLTAIGGTIVLLRRRRGPGSMPARLWAKGFACIGAAAFFGGTWHGFAPRLSPMTSAVLWKATMAGTGFAAFFLVVGAAFGSVGRRPATVVTALAAGKLAVFLFWAATHDEYDGVVVDTGVAMAAILLLQLLAWVSRRAPSAPGISAGILVSLAAAAVEALGLSPGGPFSHDDLYHVIEIVALLLLCAGGLRLEVSTIVE